MRTITFSNNEINSMLNMSEANNKSSLKILIDDGNYCIPIKFMRLTDPKTLCQSGRFIDFTDY